MQLLILKVLCNVAKLDFWTPRANFGGLGGWHKSLLQPLGLPGSFMVALLFNKEAITSPPWGPMAPTRAQHAFSAWASWASRTKKGGGEYGGDA